MLKNYLASQDDDSRALTKCGVHRALAKPLVVQAAFDVVLCFSFSGAHPFSPVQSSRLPFPTTILIPVEFYVVIGGDACPWRCCVIKGKATGLAALSAYLFHLHFPE